MKKFVLIIVAFVVLSTIVFGNDGIVAFSRCFLPKDDDSKPLGVYAKGGYSKLISLKVHKIRSIWEKSFDPD